MRVRVYLGYREKVCECVFVGTGAYAKQQVVVVVVVNESASKENCRKEE